MSTALCLLLSIFLYLPAEALLNGQRIPASTATATYPVVSLKIKNSGEVVRCTGTFVSKNTVITAAHCFDPVTSACNKIKNCRRLEESHAFLITNTKHTSLLINDLRYSDDFRVLLHPDYRSVHSIGYENYDKTNEDVALIVLPELPVRQTYVRVSQAPPRRGDALWTYGSGMTQVKLFNNPDTGEAYNIEENAGALQKRQSKLATSPSQGLLELQSVLIGRRVDNHLYDLTVKEGLQVLSADSGGPLIHDKKITGIIRNFAFAFFPHEKKNAMEISGRSIFTSLTTANQQRFLKSAEKHGGKVSF